MDLFSHQVYIESQRTKQDRQIASSLLRCWKAVGLQDFLQLDNELSFRGSNRYSRSPGLVIRLCLHFGVQPVFIPIGEPWRNGVIEKFNDTYNKKFFRQQWFPSYLTLKRQSKNFQRFHNKAPRRKRTGYQSGIKTNLDDGGKRWKFLLCRFSVK